MDMREYIISIFSENHAGVMNRITSLFLRRKINIESIKVSEVPPADVKIIDIVVRAAEDTIGALVRQIEKIVEVLKADYCTAEGLIAREVALFRVSKGVFENDVAEQLSCTHGMRIIGMEEDCVIMEKTGLREEIDAMREDLRRRGLLVQLSRSGTVILHRESVEEALGGLI